MMPEFTLAKPYGTLLALVPWPGYYLCRASSVIS